MTYYDEQLKQLQQQVARKKHLGAMLANAEQEQKRTREELDALVLAH